MLFPGSEFGWGAGVSRSEYLLIFRNLLRRSPVLSAGYHLKCLVSDLTFWGKQETRDGRRWYFSIFQSLKSWFFYGWWSILETLELLKMELISKSSWNVHSQCFGLHNSSCFIVFKIEWLELNEIKMISWR